MALKIQAYQPKDKINFVEAYGKLHEYLVAIDPLKRLRKEEGYEEFNVEKLLKLVSENNGIIYIAEYAGEMCGFISGFIMQQSQENLLEVNPTTLGEILDLYVSDEYRGKHVGSALMDKMEAYLKANGCDSIWISVSAFNINAHEFYKKYGYANREIGLLKVV